MKLRNVFSVFFVLSALTACGDSGTNTTTQNVVSSDPASAPGTQVGVVIAPDDKTTSTYFISNPSNRITGLQALEQTGVSMETQTFSFGPAICSINGVGDPADNCFGNSESKFWAFFVRNSGGDWHFSETGVGEYEVRDGDVLGFSWTGSDADFNPVFQPPSFSLNDIYTK